MKKIIDGNCIKCGIWRDRLQRDHIVPIYKGGADDSSNIQLLCANCHEDKSLIDLKGLGRGRRHSPEQREKMRQANRARPKSSWAKGWKHTAEAREKISNARKGKAWSEKRRAAERLYP